MMEETHMEKMKTPYYIIDLQILEHYWHMLENSLNVSWGNYQVGYSFKTNSLPWLVKYVKEKGAFAEVVSNDEYLLARYLGFDDCHIIYNGPYKEKESFSNVVLGNGIVNIDSAQELKWLEGLSKQYPDIKFKVGIRVNFDLESCCPGETTMGKTSGRFGFCYETGYFKKVLDRISNLKNVKLSGIHLHCSTKSRSVNVFKSIARQACKLKEEFGLDLSYVDIGGGYCGGIEGRPEYPDYFGEVSEVLSQQFNPQKTKLIVEPGISLISKCMTFVTSVFDVRDIRGTRYVMTDGSRFNIDPTMIKNSYFYHVIKDDVSIQNTLEKQVISGFSCMETDRLFIIKNENEIKVGDQIVYENVGGYTMCLNPLFIQYFPPVYVLDNKRLIMVRRKWEPKDYVAGTEELE